MTHLNLLCFCMIHADKSLLTKPNISLTFNIFFLFSLNTFSSVHLSLYKGTTSSHYLQTWGPPVSCGSVKSDSGLERTPCRTFWLDPVWPSWSSPATGCRLVPTGTQWKQREIDDIFYISYQRMQSRRTYHQYMHSNLAYDLSQWVMFTIKNLYYGGSWYPKMIMWRSCWRKGGEIRRKISSKSKRDFKEFIIPYTIPQAIFYWQ